MNPNQHGSNRDSPDWIKTKTATINPINDDDKCFQYAATVTLNHEEIGRNSLKISKIKSFISKYNWKGINFPSRKDDQKKSEKNIVTIALNVLHVKNEKIYPALVSKQNKLLFQ